MSIHVMSWVLKRSPARLGERLVLLVLADHASDDGTDAFAAVSTIAFEARISERAAQYALRNLEAGGAIAATGVHPQWGTTIYSVRMDDSAERYASPRLEKREREGGADIAPPSGPSSDSSETDPIGGSELPAATTTRGADIAPGAESAPVHLSTGSVSKSAPKPSSKPSIEDPPLPPKGERRRSRLAWEEQARAWALQYLTGYPEVAYKPRLSAMGEQPPPIAEAAEQAIKTGARTADDVRAFIDQWWAPRWESGDRP